VIVIAIPEFGRLAHCFLQDEFNWGVDNETEWINKVLRRIHLPASGVKALKAFLDQLLAQADDSVIQTVWWSTCPSYFVAGPGALRQLLAHIRQQMETVEIKGISDER
jgi:hypothetical protein